MKTDMSSFDILAVVTELKGDVRIKKVYQPSPGQLRVLLRYRDGSAKNLIVEVGKNIYLSDYAVPSPRKPSNFAMTLRKYLSNAVVTGVQQVGFDRIVELTVETGEGEFKLVFELFGEGNSLLIDSERIIRAVMKRRR
ncbi:MAG: NFACT family protein, partial [Candidatus Hydrothermarchaeales archaeon]